MTPTHALASYPGSFGKVAFLAEEDEVGPVGERLRILDPATGKEITVEMPCLGLSIFSPQATGQIAWSPDGTKLAFVANIECGDYNSEGSAIFTVNAQGYEFKQVTKGKFGATVSSPTWTPDGQEIAYAYSPGEAPEGATNGECPEQIWTASADGGSERSDGCLTSYHKCSRTLFQPPEEGSDGYETAPESFECGPPQIVQSTGIVEGQDCATNGGCPATVQPLQASPTETETYALLATEYEERDLDLGEGIDIPVTSRGRTYPVIVSPQGVRPLTGVAQEYSFDGETEPETSEEHGASPDFTWLPNGKGLLVAGGEGIHEVMLNGEEAVLPDSVGARKLVADGDGSHVLYEGCLAGGSGECGLIEQRLPNSGASVSPNEPEQALYPGFSLPQNSTYDVQSQQLPIIYLPGFAASEIKCGSEVLWPPHNVIAYLNHIERMSLAADGFENTGCEGAQAGGVIHEVLFKSIVGALPGFLAGQRLPQGAGGGVFPTSEFGWDWRLRPQWAVPSLEALIDKLLEEPVEKAEGATRVTLLAHSYGGLLARTLLSSDKSQVARVLTLGTPYWGAPKSIFPLAYGVETILSSSLDPLLVNSEFQKLAQNLSGLYELYPTPQFGRWLKVDGQYVEVPKEIETLGGNTALYTQAQEDHSELYNGFPLTSQDGIEYQEVVGSGLETITSVAFDTDPLGDDGEEVSVELGPGDGTVPLLSADQGTSTPPAPYASQVICGVEHMDLPGEEAILKDYEGFLRAGELPRALPQTPCPTKGGVFTFSSPGPLGAQASIRAGKATPTDARSALTPGEAEEEGAAEVIEAPHETLAIIRRPQPTSITVEGTDVRVVYRSAGEGEMGAPVEYAPVSGKITITSGEGGAAPTLSVGGETVLPTSPTTGGPGTSDEGTASQDTGATSQGAGAASRGAGTASARHSAGAARPPVLADLHIAPTAIAVRQRKRRPNNISIEYSDTQTALSTLTFDRAESGVAHGHQCVALPRHIRGRVHYCTRYTAVARLTHTDVPGPNRVLFDGIVNGHRLPPGRYKVLVRAQNAQGQDSATITGSLTIGS